MNTEVNETLLRIISSWETTSHTLDFLLDHELQQSELKSSARAQVTEQASNWARGRGSASFLLSRYLTKGPGSLPPLLRRRLEAAVCRILFEERTPKSVIVSRAVEDIKTAFGPHLAGLANATLRRIASEPAPWPDRETDPEAYIIASTSHPAWIIERWSSRGDFSSILAQAQWDNERPVIWLRWNSLRGDTTAARNRLERSGLEVEVNADFDGFYRLKSPFYPKAAELVSSGDFQVQDPSASLAVRLLDPRPGTEIGDLCAAPGGKTTLLAQLTLNQAAITAVDSSAHRLSPLVQSLPKLGISSIDTITVDARTFASDPGNQNRFDAVLSDVPCSGFGVLARRADLRWRRKPEDLVELVSLQRELIVAGSRCVKPGGVLVYSTCSIEPQENQEIVHGFLSDFNNFRAGEIPPGIPERFICSPGEVATNSPRDHIDGVYAARLIRVS